MTTLKISRFKKYRKATMFVILVTIFTASAVIATMINTLQTHTASSPVITNLWPNPNTSIGGIQTFKALLSSREVSDYTMYWTVDGGPLNPMPTNITGYPDKETTIDVGAWKWQADNTYTVAFIAKNHQGSELARTTFTVSVPPPAAPTIIPKSASNDSLANAVSSSKASAPSHAAVSSPLQDVALYVDPNSSAKLQADAWRASRPADAAQLDKLAARAQTKWFGGWNKDIAGEVNAYVSAAAAQSAVPVIAAYNIPQRDCGGFSAGGTSADSYPGWIKSLAAGIGSRRALVILEPDSLANLDCLSGADQATRLSLLSQAVNVLKSNAGTRVYLDAANPHWKTADVIGSRLNKANIAAADGFALNVSNFYTTAENTIYGQAISSYVNNKHFVIDTSRNGLGPAADAQWCNPTGRALGNSPSTHVANALTDAYLWIKSPGESDGSCNGSPAAGAWWPDYALGLAQRASY